MWWLCFIPSYMCFIFSGILCCLENYNWWFFLVCGVVLTIFPMAKYLEFKYIELTNKLDNQQEEEMGEEEDDDGDDE